MITCKICDNIYHEQRSHCPVCGACLDHSGDTYNYGANGYALIPLERAINARPVKQDVRINTGHTEGRLKTSDWFALE
jgi:ferredoxin